MNIIRLYLAILNGINEALVLFDLDDFDFNDEVKNDIMLNKEKSSKAAIQKVKHTEIYYLLGQILDKKQLSEQDILKVDDLIKLGAKYKATNKTLKPTIEKYIEIKGNNCDLNWIDTSEVTDMSNMFLDSSFNGDISKWDVSNVTDMNGMFERSLFDGDISKWDVSNVTDMSHIFRDSKFNSDISKWNTSNVADMHSMFTRTKFNSDISNWDVSNVTDMSFMFYGSEFNGDISKWNTSKVTDMYSMFYDSKFNQDISKWNIFNVTDMKRMFENCPIPEENKPPKFRTPL